MSTNKALSCAQSRQAIADHQGELELPLRAHLEGCKDCSAAWDRQMAVRKLLERQGIWPQGGESLDRALATIGAGQEPEGAPSTGAKPKRLLREPLNDAGEADDTIGLYLREIGGIALLSGEDEQDLAKAYEAGILATEQLSDPSMVDGLGQDDLRELRRLVDRGERARSRLIQANSRLVVHIAKKYINHGVPFQDLIQEGNLGLMRAVEKFDYKKGFKFSTYATWWIRQAITRALADQSRTIRVPAHLAETISKLKAVTRRLEQELGRDPTTEEVAAELDITPERVTQVLQIARRPISLEMPVGEDAESEYGDFLPDEVSPTPDDNVGRKLLREALDRALAELNDREAAVLAMRYGLMDGETHTLEEVGKRFGVTRERIRQIERKAIRRLRHPSRSGRLRDGLG